MPRLTNRLPKYCRHANGQAYVRLSGRSYYLGPYGSAASKAEYRRAVAEWEACGRAVGPASDLTMNEFMLAYLKHAQAYYVKNGQQTDEVHCIKSALKPVRLFYGHTPVAEFGPSALKAVRERMISSKHRLTGKPWSRRYINKATDRIRRMFRWGVENDLVPPSVHQKLQAVAGLRQGRSKARETEPRRPVPREHIEAVRGVVRQRTRDLMDLALLTAARPGELTMLTGAMVDRQNAVWVARLVSHKTEHHGKARLLFFGPQAQLILRRYLKANPDVRLFPMKEWGSGIKAACDKLGIPRFTPHWLRHTALTRIRADAGKDAAQLVAGHADARITELYAQPDVQKAVELMQRVG